MESAWKLLSSFLSIINPFKGDQEQPQPRPTSLRFHTTYGDNVNLNEIGDTATRRLSYDGGVVFSNRPIQINEIVPVKVLEVRRYKGPLSFGFTSIDPSSLRPDELHIIKTREYRECGVWLKGLHQHDMEPNLVVQFRVSENGIVRYSVNETSYETPLFRLQASVPLWAVFDIYGSVGSIKFIDVPLSTELCSPLEHSQLPSIFVFPPVPDRPMSFSRNRSTSNTRSPRASPVPGALLGHPNPSPTSPLNSSFSDGSGFHTATTTTPSASVYRECIICVTEEATTAFIRCGHLCVCQQCASRLMDSADHGCRRKTHACPMCRAPIVDLLRVYAG